MHQISVLFEVSRKSGSRSLEGLRGIAALLVFLVHYVALAEPWTDHSLRSIAAAVHAIGATGVDLFFVLSGFLIYGKLIAKPSPFLPFLLRRVQRIYPTFLVVLTFYIALSHLFPAASRIPLDPWHGTLYLVQNALLMPGIFPIEPMITVTWSLSYAMLFYLIVPLLVGCALRWCPQRTRGALIVSAAACCLLVLDGEYQRLVMFGSGMAAFELSKSRVRAPPAWLTVISVASSMAAMLVSMPTEARRIALFVGVGVLCWHAVSRPSWLTAALAWAPLRWYGNMSYSFYLVHGLALKVTFLVIGMLVLPDTNLVLVMLLPAFVATLIPSAALYLAVERPLSLQPPERSTVATLDSPSERVRA